MKTAALGALFICLHTATRVVNAVELRAAGSSQCIFLGIHELETMLDKGPLDSNYVYFVNKAADERNIVLTCRIKGRWALYIFDLPRLSLVKTIPLPREANSGALGKGNQLIAWSQGWTSRISFANGSVFPAVDKRYVRNIEFDPTGRLFSIGTNSSMDDFRAELREVAHPLRRPFYAIKGGYMQPLFVRNNQLFAFRDTMPNSQGRLTCVVFDLQTLVPIRSFDLRGINCVYDMTPDGQNILCGYERDVLTDQSGQDK